MGSDVLQSAMVAKGGSARGMEFICDQSWDRMSPIVGGRFCDSCQRPVIDFTGWSREELIAWFKREPESCGQFEPHQVDPTLIPIERVGKGFRRGFLASMTALALNSGHAQQPPAPPPTEQVVPVPVPRPRDLHAEQENPATDPKAQPPCSPLPVQPAQQPSHRFYVSKRFPFLHITRRNWRGRARRQDIIF